MRLTESGGVCCPNCGSDRFVSPQMVASPNGGQDVFLSCANCSKPMFVFNESDEAAAKELAAFFIRPADHR